MALLRVSELSNIQMFCGSEDFKGGESERLIE
jgi:hypothetical protein